MRPHLVALDPADIPAILEDALRILDQIGVGVESPALSRHLLDRGLPRDPESGRFRFPPSVVEQALATAPRQFTLYDREGRPHAHLGDGRVHFVPGSSALQLLDYRSGQVRPPTTQDFVEYVLLTDQLPHLAYLATAFSTHDVPQAIADAWRLALCLLHSRQPVVSGAFTAHGVPRMARMLAFFRNNREDLAVRPLAIFTITATGHFRYGADSCQNLLDCAAWGIPVEIVPVTLMGLIAPVTLAEATAFHVADVLAGLAMAQILCPGLPVLFGGAPAAFHMQTTASPMAAIEAIELTLAYSAVGRYLGLPTQAYLALSDSSDLDAQAGGETFVGAVLAALAGINSVSGPGMLEYVATFSLAKLVLDDDLCGQALHLVRPQEPPQSGRAVALARELLKTGHLLTARHTLDHWRQELYLPHPVIDRTTRQDAGPAQTAGPSLVERAAARVKELLAQAIADRPDPHQEQALLALLREDLSPHPGLPPIPRLEPTAPPAPGRRRGRRGRRGTPDHADT